ncbi:ABC transporter substrate-binding protein [Candidatus Latescibacterota bacterium]
MKLLHAFAVVLLLFLMQSCSDFEIDLLETSNPNSIKIGVILPLTIERGRQESGYFVAVMAAEEINRAGGINGRNIEIVLKNDGGSTTKGPEEALSLYNDGVDIILGPAWSSVTMAVSQEVTIPNEMLLISHSATSPRITALEDNGLVWRMAPSDALQGKLGADYLYNVLGKKTVGVIYSTSIWGTDLAGVFKSTFEELGGSDSVVSFVSFPEEQDWATYNFTTHLDELFENKPEAIYIVSFDNDGAKITNDIYVGDYVGADYTPLFFSCDGPKSNDFLINGHPEIIDGMIGTLPTGLISDANYTVFIENYKERFGYAPAAYAEHLYDAVYLVAYAMLAAGSELPVDVAAELRSVSGGDLDDQGEIINVNEFAEAYSIISNGGTINYNGASGSIELDANGDPVSGVYKIWKVVNGDYVIEQTIIF